MTEDEIKRKILDNVTRNLADNYRDDVDTLREIIDNVSCMALSISNRKSLSTLEPEIGQCVIAEYLRRGAEGSSSISESGHSISFEDNIEKMRNNIIKNGKRVIF